MRVQTEEWQRFIPGSRMYKGKKTLFYNGEILWEGDMLAGHPLIYNKQERESWEVIIVLPGVEVIPDLTFGGCNVEIVVMSDTVQRIDGYAFHDCDSLVFIKLSTDLEYIGWSAFRDCKSLTSIFIPPSCTLIGYKAFYGCEELIIFSIPQDTDLDTMVIEDTALYYTSPFFNSHIEINNEMDQEDFDNQVNDWIKNINNDEEYVLHRACSSFNASEDIIYDLFQRERGLHIFNRPNSIGITPSQYLDANPFTEVKEQKIINRFVLEMMGEIFSNLYSHLSNLWTI